MKDRELWDIVDPVDAKLLALMTQLSSVEKQLAEARSATLAPPIGAFLSDSKPPAKKNKFDTHCTQYVDPYTVLDGDDYDWCDKGHKSAASPNGMYMPEGHDHEYWLKEKLAYRNKSSGASKSDGDEPDKLAPSSDPKSIKLTLSEQMKTCLMSKAGFSEEETDAIFKDMNLN